VSASEPRARELTCPSWQCEPGATLLGVVNAGGTVGYITPALEVDEDFVARAHRGRTPERRFRFAGPCVEGRCRHWTGERCGVIDEVMSTPDPPAVESLPRCSIRSNCRWFDQAGADACRVCPFVVTDLRKLEAETINT
jgi:hypothetical protein